MAVRTRADYSVPGNPKICWDDPAVKDALVSALVNDANTLVAALGGQELEQPAAAGGGVAGAGRRRVQAGRLVVGLLLWPGHAGTVCRGSDIPGGTPAAQQARGDPGPELRTAHR